MYLENYEPYKKIRNIVAEITTQNIITDNTVLEYCNHVFEYTFLADELDFYTHNRNIVSNFPHYVLMIKNKITHLYNLTQHKYDNEYYAIIEYIIMETHATKNTFKHIFTSKDIIFSVMQKYFDDRMKCFQQQYPTITIIDDYIISDDFAILYVKNEQETVFGSIVIDYLPEIKTFRYYSSINVLKE